MKHLLGFGISSALTLALRALTLPLMSWLVAPELLAQFALWQLGLALARLLIGQGLGHALQREFHELDPAEQPLLLAHMLQSALLLWLGAGTLVLVAGAIGLDEFSKGAGTFMLLLFVALPLHLWLQWGSSYLRLQQQALNYALIQVGGRLLWLLLLLGLWWFSVAGLQTMWQLLTLWLVAETLNALWLLWVMRPMVSLAWQQRRLWGSALWRQRLQSMRRYARPLLLSEGMYWAMSALGAVLLTAWHGLQTMAVYAMAVALGGVGSMAGQLFNTLWLPEVYRAHRQQGELPWLPRRAQQAVWVVLLLTLLGALGSTVVWWLLPPHYAAVPYLLAATLLKPLLMALQRVTAIGVELQRATWVSPAAMLAGLITQLLLAWWLIPLYAAAGAVVSLLIGAWVFWQLKSWASARLWGEIGGWRIYLPVLAGVTLAAAVALR
jgi:O-antigen/teichoic acid export membrane protein